MGALIRLALFRSAAVRADLNAAPAELASRIHELVFDRAAQSLGSNTTPPPTNPSSIAYSTEEMPRTSFEKPRTNAVTWFTIRSLTNATA